VYADSLIAEGKKEKISVESYTFSPDETKLLITTNSKKIYRHSTTANFYVWNFKKQKLYSLTDKENQRLATFSPMSDKVAFIWDNNLFYKDLITNEEYKSPKTARRTIS